MLLDCTANHQEEKTRQKTEEHAHWSKHEREAISLIELKPWALIRLLIFLIRANYIQNIYPDNIHHSDNEKEETWRKETALRVGEIKSNMKEKEIKWINYCSILYTSKWGRDTPYLFTKSLTYQKWGRVHPLLYKGDDWQMELRKW